MDRSMIRSHPTIAEAVLSKSREAAMARFFEVWQDRYAVKVEVDHKAAVARIVELAEEAARVLTRAVISSARAGKSSATSCIHPCIQEHIFVCLRSNLDRCRPG